jgi:flagellar protein FlbT
LSLKIHLGPGEHIIINGALIQAVESCHIVFINNASFLTQRHIMPPTAANTPARRIYYTIQNAYLASDADRPPLLEALDELVDDFAGATTVESIRTTLQTLKDHIINAQFYQALKLAMIVIKHEERVLGLEGWQRIKPQRTLNRGPA